MGYVPTRPRPLPIQGAGIEYRVMSEKEPLVLFEEEDWSIQQGLNFFSKSLNPFPMIAHKHKNWRGKESWRPCNYWDFGSFYNFGTGSVPDGWNMQCSKCGEEPPSEVKTRFRIMED